MLSVFNNFNPNSSADGFYIILKWLPITVENHYLNDVSVKENDKENLVNIGYNNREITIHLADSVNPTNNYYELYDISGKLVERIKLYSHQTVLSMPKVSSGIYVIRVKGKNLSRFGFEVGAGLTADWGAFELTAKYDGKFRSDYTDNTGILEAKYNF